MAKINRSCRGITHLIKSVLTETTERAASLEGKKRNKKRDAPACLGCRINDPGLFKPVFDETIQIDLKGNLRRQYLVEAGKFLICDAVL